MTTPSRGGRDEFFHPDYVVTAEPRAAAVAAAVRAALRAGVNAEEIRRRTLEQMHVHRRALIDLCDDLIASHGGGRPFVDDFARVFFNRLVKRRPLTAFPRER